MEINQQRAYEHLTEQEKLVLSLVIVNTRSFKEVAAIIDVSPYKVKEIYFRAKKYFLIFSEFYQAFDTIFPPGLNINPIFESYVIDLIKHRKPTGIIGTDERYLLLASPRTVYKAWHDLFNLLGSEQRLHHLSLFRLILEFDKWADKRILPKVLQKPSAYARRRLRSFKKLKKEMVEISALSWDLINQMYGDKKGKGQVIAFYDGEYSIIPILVTKGSFDYLVRNRILVYENLAQANALGTLVQNFEAVAKNTTRSSAVFWAEFRVISFRASNIEEIMGIKKDEFLELSQKDMEFLAKVKEKERRKPTYKKSDDKLFW